MVCGRCKENTNYCVCGYQGASVDENLIIPMNAKEAASLIMERYNENFSCLLIEELEKLL